MGQLRSTFNSVFQAFRAPDSTLVSRFPVAQVDWRLPFNAVVKGVFRPAVYAEISSDTGRQIFGGGGLQGVLLAAVWTSCSPCPYKVRCLLLSISAPLSLPATPEGTAATHSLIRGRKLCSTPWQRSLSAVGPNFPRAGLEMGDKKRCR